jgi:hypothetical protein
MFTLGKKYHCWLWLWKSQNLTVLVIVPLGPEIEYIVISLLLSVLVFLIVDNEDERAEL